MAFAAQIDTSILPAFDAPWELATPWKYQGMLFRFFTDLLEDPVEPGPALALVTDPRGPLTRTPAPPVPDRFPAGGRLDDWEEREELSRLPETVVELLPLSPRQRRTRRCTPTIGMTAPPQIVTKTRRRACAWMANRTVRRTRTSCNISSASRCQSRTMCVCAA
jgi:hypothetical protein